MHSRHFIIFAGALCIAAMLAYLFVFADAPIVDVAPPPAADTAPPPAATPDQHRNSRFFLRPMIHASDWLGSEAIMVSF